MISERIGESKMINSGKCPSCGQVPRQINIETVTVGALMAPSYKGVSYVCPNPACRAILGVQMDPIALDADLVNLLLKKLRGQV